MDLIFGLNLGPKLEDWLLKVGKRVFLLIGKGKVRHPYTRVQNQAIILMKSKTFNPQRVYNNMDGIALM